MHRSSGSTSVLARFVALLVFLSLSADAVAENPTATQNPIVLAGTDERVVLGAEDVWRYEDATTQASLADVRSNPDWFSASDSPTRCDGYRTYALWSRFIWSDASTRDEWLLEVSEKSLDTLDVYTRSGNGFRRTSTGDMMPFHTRPSENRNFVFPLDPPSAPDTTFVRVRTSGPVCLPMTVYSAAGFAAAERRRHFFIGGFFGILAVMLLFNLLIYVEVRENQYLLYVLYIAGYLLYQIAIERIGFAYLWPGSPGWEQLSYNTFGLATGMLSIQFARAFLETKRNARRLDPWLIALIAAGGSLLALNFVPGVSRHIASVATIVYFVVLTLLLTVAGFVCHRAGYRQARFYLIAWSFLLVATLVAMLGFLDIVPMGNLRLRSVQVGGAIELTLMSLALGFAYKWEREGRVRDRADATTAVHGELGRYVTDIGAITSGIRRNPTSVTIADGLTRIDAISADMHSRIREAGGILFPQSDIRSVSGLKELLAAKFRDLLEDSDLDLEHRWRPDPDEREGDPRIPERISFRIQRIVTDITANTLRHARARKLTFLFRIHGGYFHFIAWDDGVGLGPDWQHGKGRGVNDIHEHARLAGGSVVGPEKDAGGGVRWSGRLPLRRFPGRTA